MAHPFRAAVEAKDLDAMIEALADDVTFRSPVVFKPYEGREAVGQLLSLVAQVFEDFEYVDELHGERDGRETLALVFRAKVGDKQVDGWDYLTLNADGQITEFMVMVRPMSGMMALAEQMRAKLEAVAPGG
jgi:hypothetical protein